MVTRWMVFVVAVIQSIINHFKKVKKLTNKSRTLHQELKQNFVIERLQKLGVTHSQLGRSIHECSYDELLFELVIASFKEIDSEHAESKWF
jgi:hypothetical protein